jgi:DNA-binding transcriptional LysR family regulator
MDQLRALRYFSKVAETGSFTLAARVFDVPPSSLSRRVADLEKSLGATLLKRSTRVVKLTEIGQTYYSQISDILSQLEQSNEVVSNYQAKPMGHLHISSMVSLGERILLPLLDEFGRLYPDIILDVSLTDELSTLSRDDVDIAIRGGYAPNERPSYLANMGRPKSVLELAQHKGIYFRTPNGPTPWLCYLDGQWQDVSAPQVAVSNNGGWLAKKALNGEGIMMAPWWVLTPYIKSGALQELHFEAPLSISQNDDLAVYLLYQKHRYLVPKVKVAVDFLAARITG